MFKELLQTIFCATVMLNVQAASAEMWIPLAPISVCVCLITYTCVTSLLMLSGTSKPSVIKVLQEKSMSENVTVKYQRFLTKFFID